MTSNVIENSESADTIASIEAFLGFPLTKAQRAKFSANLRKVEKTPSEKTAELLARSEQGVVNACAGLPRRNTRVNADEDLAENVASNAMDEIIALVSKVRAVVELVTKGEESESDPMRPDTVADANWLLNDLLDDIHAWTLAWATADSVQSLRARKQEQAA